MADIVKLEREYWASTRNLRGRDMGDRTVRRDLADALLAAKDEVITELKRESENRADEWEMYEKLYEETKTELAETREMLEECWTSFMCEEDPSLAANTFSDALARLKRRVATGQTWAKQAPIDAIDAGKQEADRE